MGWYRHLQLFFHNPNLVCETLNHIVNKSLLKMKLCKLFYVQVVPRHLLIMSKLILIRLKTYISQKHKISCKLAHSLIEVSIFKISIYKLLQDFSSIKPQSWTCSATKSCIASWDYATCLLKCCGRTNNKTTY